MPGKLALACGHAHDVEVFLEYVPGLFLVKRQEGVGFVVLVFRLFGEATTTITPFGVIVPVKYPMSGCLALCFFLAMLL
jgi:hypothetical protein